MSYLIGMNVTSFFGRAERNLRRLRDDAEMFTTRLANLRQNLVVREDTSGDKFWIELDRQEFNNRVIGGELKWCPDYSLCACQKSFLFHNHFC